MSFLANALTALAGFILTVVLARAMGAAEFGVYTFVIAVVSLLGLPVQMGIATLVVRETARTFAREQWRLMQGLWIWAIGFVAITSSIIVGFVLGFNSVLEAIVSPNKINALSHGIFLVMLLAFSSVLSSILRGLKHVFWGAFGDGILRQLCQATMILIAANGINRMITANEAILLYEIAVMLSLIIGFVLLMHLKPTEASVKVGYEFRNGKWFAALFPLGMIGGLQLIQSNTDLIMLGMLATDEAVGQYRIAVRAAALVVFGLSALNAVIQPYIADLHARRDWARLQTLVGTSAFWGGCLTLPVVILLIVWGQQLLVMAFGIEFSNAYVPLIILVTGQVINAFFGPVGLLLIMSGNDRMVLRGGFISTIANVVLNMLLIPTYGMAGAAFASTISIVLWNVFFWVGAKQKLGVDGSVMSYMAGLKVPMK